MGKILLLIVFTCLTAPCPAAADEVVADFSSHTYDRWSFRAVSAPKGQAWGRWDLDDPGLRAWIPRGKTDRLPLQFVGLFTLHGDFEVTAGYVISRLPRPKSDDGANRLQIFLRSPGRTALLYRDATHSADSFGYDVFAQSDSSSTGQITARSAKGRIRVERRGTKLRFARSEGGGPLETIGSAVFDEDPLTEVKLEVDPIGTTDELDVRFDRLEVRADRIDRRTPPGREGSSYWVWALGLAVAAVGLAFARRRFSPAR